MNEETNKLSFFETTFGINYIPRFPEDIRIDEGVLYCKDVPLCPACIVSKIVVSDSNVLFVLKFSTGEEVKVSTSDIFSLVKFSENISRRLNIILDRRRVEKLIGYISDYTLLNRSNIKKVELKEKKKSVVEVFRKTLSSFIENNRNCFIMEGDNKQKIDKFYGRVTGSTIYLTPKAFEKIAKDMRKDSRFLKRVLVEAGVMEKGTDGRIAKRTTISVNLSGKKIARVNVYTLSLQEEETAEVLI